MNDSLTCLVYRDARKSVYNKLRRFQAESLLMAFLRRLQAVERADPQTLSSQPPWRLLLLLKWTLAQGTFGSTLLPAVSANEVNALINQVGELEAKLTMPSECSDFYLYIRKLLYQQTWHQEGPQRSHVARQSRIFGSLSPEHPLAQRFVALTGVTVSDFLVVSFAILSAFLSGKLRIVTREFFAPLESRFTRGVVDRTLAVLSREPRELRELLRQTAPSVGYEHFEFHERTPLTRYPLLRIGNHYCLYCITVLVRGLETAVYDILKSHDPSTFLNEFGALFESYVRLGVEALGCPFLDERDLKKRFGKTRKVVDFSISAGNATVLIDAKGVELNAHAMQATSGALLTARVETSILKGIAQASDLACRMNLSEPPYVLIVTFKDLFLGSGLDFARYADPARLATSVGNTNAIDMRRVSFVSAEEFDYLVAGLSANNIPLARFLEDISNSDSTPETKRMQMMQHINDRLRPYGSPRYLETEFASIVESAKQSLVF